jgi:hypothetical protein
MLCGMPKLEALLLSAAVLIVAALTLWGLGAIVTDLLHAITAGLAVAGG